MIDSIRNYHKGGHCLKNHRVVLRINYSTLDTTYPFEKRKDLIKIYKKLDLEKNYFKNYLFRDKNIFFELLKIPQKLFSFYHLVSIKKMKKLYLHIGYPKCASTFLQRNF